MPPRPEADLLMAEEGREAIDTAASALHIPRSVASGASSETMTTQTLVKAEIKHAFVKLAIQATLSTIAVGFAAGMLATHAKSEAYYLPIITAVLGFWLPAPSFPVVKPHPQP